MRRFPLAETWRSLTTLSPVPSPRPSRWAWAADAALAIVLAAATMDDALRRHGPRSVSVDTSSGGPLPPAPPAPPEPPPGPPVELWNLALLALTALPLVARRRYPLAVLWTVVGATLLTHLAPDRTVSAYLFVSCGIAAYSAVVYSPYRRAAAVSALIGGGLVVLRLESVVASLPPFLVVVFALLPAGLAANAINVWRQRVRALEAEREVLTRLAVSQERARLARELHDVVTHSVSVMVVQAGAARMVLQNDPERAQDALRAVESGGRAALTELRHVMGLLTMDGENLSEDTELTPQPGLDRLDALAGQVRASGVPVELTVTGEPAPLPPGVELAAYRVAQEAVTNSLKHAAGASISIRVDYAPDKLRVEVTDTGGVPSAAAAGGDGRGLSGMRERLALYEGTLEAGPRPGDTGFRVRATVPLAAP